MVTKSTLASGEWRCAREMSNSIGTSAPSTCDLGPVIINIHCNLNASYEGVAANVAAQSSTSIVGPSTCFLTDQLVGRVNRPCRCLPSQSGIGGRPVSAVHASRSLSSRTFTSSMYCTTSSLALLTISGFNGNPMLLSLQFLGIGCAVRERQHLLLQSRPSLHCCDCQLSISTHQPPALRLIPRLACSNRKARSVAATNRGRYFSQAFPLPFKQLDVIVSTKTAFCSQPPRCTHHVS